MHAVPPDILDALDAPHLPPMPQVLSRFLNVLSDANCTMSALADIAATDPALCARIIDAADGAGTTNTARGYTFFSLEDRLTALGPRVLRAMATAMAVEQVFRSPDAAPPCDLRGFWLHALQTATLMRAIARRVGGVDGEEAYLTGLLHDLGELALLGITGGIGDRYRALLAWSRDENTLVDLERPELATDHAQVGARLIDRWHLPSFLADAVRFHHCSATQVANTDALSRMLWAAHATLSAPPGAATDGSDMMATVALTNAADLIGLPADDLLALADSARELATAQATALGIVVEDGASPIPVAPEIPFEAPLATTSPHHAETGSLAAMVRELALSQPLLRCLSSLDKEAELLLALREAFRTLFGTTSLGFFLAPPASETTEQLRGAPYCGQTALLQRLTVPLRADHSVAAVTATRGEVKTFDASAALPVGERSLADAQIARLLGADHLHYLPLLAGGRLIGIVALALTGRSAQALAARPQELARFAALAAQCIDGWQSQQARDTEIEAAIASRFELQARKVVHEAGNPLAIIRNYLKIVSQKLPPDLEVHQELDILKEEIDRVAQIVRRLSTVSPETGASSTVDVNTLIESMLVLYSESLFANHRIAVEVDLGHNLANAIGSRDSVKQILLNLWKNAAEAMTSGGRFTVTTRDSVNHNGRLYVEIRLTDNGPGLPTEVMAQLYRPLPGNRRAGHSGLGLSIVANLVEQLEGHINCQSEAGKGTSFSVLLPQSVPISRSSTTSTT